MDFKFARRIKMPSGAGSGWCLINDLGMEVCIRHGWRGLLTFQEAVDYVNTYVRVLDDLPFDHKSHVFQAAREEREQIVQQELDRYSDAPPLNVFKMQVRTIADQAAAQGTYGS